MAPNTISKPGAVLPVEAVHFLDAHVYPALPGQWFPGVPVALDKIGVDVNDPDAVEAFKAAAAAAGAPLEYDDFEFEADPTPVNEWRESLKKLKVPALVSAARDAGVAAEQLDALQKPGVSKDTIIDAIAAAGAPQSEEE
jgi:folylpolyglutamate synthase/dihydropteroate synthase